MDELSFTPEALLELSSTLPTLDNDSPELGNR